MDVSANGHFGLGYFGLGFFGLGRFGQIILKRWTFRPTLFFEWTPRV